MVGENEKVCPKCGGKLKPYSRVKRIVRTEYGVVNWTQIPILYCEECEQYHRALPDTLLPYKHYEARIIRGVVAGTITSFDLDYEDYPCEMTMQRWLSEFTNDSVVTGSSS